MRVLVWQWGRRGAGPRFAACLKTGFHGLAGVHVTLSLSSQAEILREPYRPSCELPTSSYNGLGGLALQYVLAPVRIRALAARICALRLDVAVCAMSGPLDLLMVAALRQTGVPFAVVVHDADAHLGDGFPLQMMLQRAVVRHAAALVVLTQHVADRLIIQGLFEKGGAGRKALIRSCLPPFAFGPPPPPPRAHGGPLRLLLFGRLLPYKGLDLLTETLALLGPRSDLEVRVVGLGPESATLSALRRLPRVTVENRWVPEGELSALLAWSDAMILPYREASQSGVGAAAIAAGRWILATRVGGLQEQLGAQNRVRFADPTAASLAATLVSLLNAAPQKDDTLCDVPAAWRMAAADIAAGLEPLLLRPSMMAT